jgi:hypothetical protein
VHDKLKAADSPRSTDGKQQEDVMAKGQMRSNKEKKKPKADWNKKKKGGQPPTPFSTGPTMSGQGLGQHSANPPGKK